MIFVLWGISNNDKNIGESSVKTNKNVLKMRILGFVGSLDN